MEVAEVAGRGALIQRLFAWTTAHQGNYEASMVARKRALFGDLHGDILEIGPGAGANLRYYPADVRWVGVEPNPFMRPYLEKSIRELQRPAGRFHIDGGDPSGVHLPADDESMDAVACTLVLCSVPHPEDSLKEIVRVLKPGGRFAFIEHVAAPRGTRLRSSQDFVQPLWTLIADGCHPNRETWHAISQAGFGRVELEHFRSSGGLAGPHIAGTAVKAGARV
jgi:SAM-dependent methyltransferase